MKVRNPNIEIQNKFEFRISKFWHCFEFRFLSFEFPRRRRGAALLLSLLILGSLVAASMTIGIVVTTNLRSVRAIDDAIIASYTAESGIEEVLYAVRKNDESLLDKQTGNPIILRSGADLSIKDPPTQLLFELAKDDIEQFDVENDTQLLVSLNVASDTQCGVTGVCPFLDVTWSALDANGTWLPTHGRLIGLADGATDVSIELGAEKMFRVRMRSLYGNAGSVIVSASDSDSKPILFNSRIVATVTGAFGRAKQAYRVEFLRHAPLSPIFDHVLFSECDIVKGGSAECPTPQ